VGGEKILSARKKILSAFEMGRFVVSRTAQGLIRRCNMPTTMAVGGEAQAPYRKDGNRKDIKKFEN
jgi:hypothetical protein